MGIRALRTAVLVVAAVAASLVVSEPAGASSSTEPADAGIAATAVELQPGQNLRAAVVNRASGLCLTAFSSEAGAPVWLRDCGSYDGWHVQWEIEWNSHWLHLRKTGTSMCLVTPTWAGGLGVLYYCGYGDQLWDTEEVSQFVYQARNVDHPDWCLVGPNWSGDRAAWWHCNRDYTDQHWTVRPI